MMEVYEIDLVRALFANKLNDPTIFLASFYEQIQDQEQISRYVDTIKDLIALQNREKSESTYKAMGIVAQAGDSEILNIKTNYVVPTNYSVRLDIELTDRDYVLAKIKALINDLRGRKFELAQLDSGSVIVFANPTFTNDKINMVNNLYINQNPGTANPDDATSKTAIGTHLSTYYNLTDGVSYTMYQPNTPNAGVFQLLSRTVSVSGGIYTIGNSTNLGLYDLYKLSISFNGVQSQEPYINNGLDRVYLFFGGNVTITDEKVMLGNDIVQTTIQVGKDTGTIYNVEPNEIPASLALDTDGYGEWGTGYQGKERVIGVANKLSYSFIYDTTNALYNDWYKYSRFGIGSSTYANQEFTIKEYRYSYGVLTVDKFYAKLGEITTQNTNGDVMMLSVAMNVGAY
jgi:hypothetical protein